MDVIHILLGCGTSSHYENYHSITKILIADNIAENFISFLIPMPIIVVYTNGERAT